MPSENPNLNERGLIITDFVDRVGDPVGIVASDGSTHRADKCCSPMRCGLCSNTVARGRPTAEPVGVTYPAHWRPAAVDALRNALAAVPEFHRLRARLRRYGCAHRVAGRSRRADPRRHRPVRLRRHRHQHHAGRRRQRLRSRSGPPFGHTDLSGDLIDQALLTHVINDLSAAGSVDLTGTSAIGSLSRLRGQCRGAKERLSTTAVTSLVAELPDTARCAADPQRTRRRDPPPLTDFVACAGNRGPQRLARGSRRCGVHRRWCADPDHHHDAVRTVPGAGYHHPAAGVDGRDRRRPELAVRGMVDEGATAMAAGRPAAAAAGRGGPNGARSRRGGVEHVPGAGLVGRRRFSRRGPHRSVRLPAGGSDGGFTDAAPADQFDHEPVDSTRRRRCRGIGSALVLAGVAVLAALAVACVRDARRGHARRPRRPPHPTTTAPSLRPPAAEPPPAANAGAPPADRAAVTRQAPPPVRRRRRRRPATADDPGAAAPPRPPTTTPTPAAARPPRQPPPPTTPGRDGARPRRTRRSRVCRGFRRHNRHNRLLSLGAR